MIAAPFLSELADSPAGGAAHWLTCSDGRRIRVGHWTHEGAIGTVLLFPGRTEYIEKYGRAARDFAQRGYAMIAIDWRGQGLADRMHDNRAAGHVNRFTDYQLDVQAATAHARALGLPEPYHLVAHSMGGAIGLRALHNGLDVQTVVFSAPMWGIKMSSALRPFAWGLSTLSRSLGFGNAFAPGQNAETYLGHVAFDLNTLTNDADMFAYMQAQLAGEPDLALGGPSLHWLNEALREMRNLAAMPSPKTPCLTWLGDAEDIVDANRIHDRMRRWEGGKLIVIPSAKHEVMMETPDVRTRVFDGSVAHFDAHSPVNA